MKHSGISTAYMSRSRVLQKDQESVKDTTVQIKYKEDLMETKMDSEHISLINYRKEENAKKRA